MLSTYFTARWAHGMLRNGLALGALISAVAVTSARADEAQPPPAQRLAPQPVSALEADLSQRICLRPAPDSLSAAEKAQTTQALLETHAIAAPGGQIPGGLPGIPHIVPVALRLGAAVSPRIKFAGGIDVTLPKLSLGPGLATRIDAEAIVSANFGGISTLVPVTFNQVYSKGLIGGSRLYFGGGIGPYFGEVTRFGGKVFVGGDITSHFGLEVGINFPGFGDAIATVQLRLPL